ncbi:aminotransferase class III-fold pyridoxal phosphate-dependent enzyme [Alisedimentitalea sp. MJ-SS2]|uniref:aspartate aminotransferase family protein n=1 Tax=Aliisedimentitalea sp. MJ-SS2 TaxID=3049795 RepID=UPI0029088809|nr:aminotransferase class III-fold pyridoxal phosphate-dependent enzyme [Alisedimentitalea sp. MJ-SS2]MDU8927227.1 aminotransferase class III-fold pyridoxal phosphate-dependent enzyme [Alisedimentitalea sp. MJ-SS2]
MQKLTSQSEWIARAQKVLPAGGFGNFDPSIVIRSGHGARVADEDGNEYVDYLIGSGPMLLGHGHPEVLETVLEQIPRGMTFFANNAPGIELAEEICRAVPCAEQLRYVSSGGEADMYAIRAARAFTGRDKIVKFEGGYHGMSAEAQMSLAPAERVNFPQAQPDSAGIPQSVADEMLIAPFNDFDYIRSLLAEHGDQIAGIIVEPLQRIIPPLPGFLQLLRDEADKYGIVLIFDEVVTGFRFSYGGAQEHYGVTPDICTLGKVIGGGFPLAAIVGRADIMDHFDKSKVGAGKWLMQLGTLSGNPVAAVAGLKTLEILRRDGQFDRLRSLGEQVQSIARTALDPTGIPYQIVGDATLFDFVFANSAPRDYRDVQSGDANRNTRFNDVLRANGIFKSAGKTYPCLALSDADLELTEVAFQAAARALE